MIYNRGCRSTDLIMLVLDIADQFKLGNVVHCFLDTLMNFDIEMSDYYWR